MNTLDFNKFLLKTAFSCVACDGHIDSREIGLIRKLGNEEKMFGDIHLNGELDQLVQSINEQGHVFLREFLSELKQSQLSEEQELAVIETAIRTINADEKLEYSEIKFFKIIRSKLNISNQAILAKMPEIEDYLEQDIISESYIEKLKEQFFTGQELPQFNMVHRVDMEGMEGGD